jgi:tetratricopeptide (TPR) repeat protein
MLSLSTTPNHASLLNLVGHLLQETPSNVPVALELTGMIRTEKSPWDDCLRLANMLLNHGQIDQGKRSISKIDAVKYFRKATSAGQVNLLFSVLIRTDKGDEALSLLESTNMAKRFSVFDDMDIRLRAANALLAQGQTDQAKGLIADHDAVKYFRKATNAGQVNLLFSVLIRTDKGDEALFLLESTNMAKRFSEFDDMDIRLRAANALLAQGQTDQAKGLIAVLDPGKFIKHANNAAQVNLKLNIGRKLIMQGRRRSAKKILVSINEDKLSNKDHFDALGLSYILLSMFDKASSVFNVAERKGYIHPDLFTHMAILFFYLGKMDKASKYIDEQIQASGRTPINLLWKAKLLNYSGQYVKALYWIDILLSKFSFNPAWRCFGFVEKGNTLRLLAKYEEANICYKKAQEINHAATFWLWIACFEHAMTLIYLDKTDAALAAALKGCSYKSPVYNEKYNPCVILYHFLLFRKKRSKEFFILPENWADNARLWPFVNMPFYKKWMLLLTELVLTERKKPNAANYKFLDSEGFSTGLFPEDTFNHRLFLKLSQG